jgi:hypothetical protein
LDSGFSQIFLPSSQLVLSSTWARSGNLKIIHSLDERTEITPGFGLGKMASKSDQAWSVSLGADQTADDANFLKSRRSKLHAAKATENWTDKSD